MSFELNFGHHRSSSRTALRSFLPPGVQDFSGGSRPCHAQGFCKSLYHLFRKTLFQVIDTRGCAIDPAPGKSLTGFPGGKEVACFRVYHLHLRVDLHRPQTGQHEASKTIPFFVHCQLDVQHQIMWLSGIERDAFEAIGAASENLRLDEVPYSTLRGIRDDNSRSRSLDSKGLILSKVDSGVGGFEH